MKYKWFSMAGLSVAIMIVFASSGSASHTHRHIGHGAGSPQRAMQLYLTAIRTRNSSLLLSLVPRSGGFRVMNTIGGDTVEPPITVTFFELSKDFSRKQGAYLDYFRRSEEGSSYYSEITDMGPGAWISTLNNTFNASHDPTYGSTSYASRNQFYVRWKRENGRWVIDEVGRPIS